MEIPLRFCVGMLCKAMLLWMLGALKKCGADFGPSFDTQGAPTPSSFA